MKTAILMSAYFNIAVFPYIHKDWHGWAHPIIIGGMHKS